jgi:hypothetical protein
LLGVLLGHDNAISGQNVFRYPAGNTNVCIVPWKEAKHIYCENASSTTHSLFSFSFFRFLDSVLKRHSYSSSNTAIAAAAAAAAAAALLLLPLLLLPLLLLVVVLLLLLLLLLPPRHH